MPIPLIVYYAGAGALTIGGILWGGKEVLKEAKGIGQPIKKVAKLSALGAGTFYLRKVANTTNSQALKKVANVATIGAVALIGKEVLKGEKTYSQVKPESTATEALANNETPNNEEENPKYWWSL